MHNTVQIFVKGLSSKKIAIYVYLVIERIFIIYECMIQFVERALHETDKVHVLMNEFISVFFHAHFSLGIKTQVLKTEVDYN